MTPRTRLAALGAAALAAALAAVLSACAGPTGAPSGDGGTGTAGTADSELLVLAAASLTEPFTALAPRFEQTHPGTTVNLAFGGSSALAVQISHGAPADVFASAAPQPMDSLVAAGWAETPSVFASNSMQVAVPADNPAHVSDLADLARPDVKVALCRPEVPCGAGAAAVLDAAGLRVRPVTLEADVRATLTKVELGEVDAAIVYASDVLSAGGTVEGIAIADAVNVSTSYPIARLSDSENPDLAAAFVDYVVSDDGLATLADAGFQAPRAAG